MAAVAWFAGTEAGATRLLRSLFGLGCGANALRASASFRAENKKPHGEPCGLENGLEENYLFFAVMISLVSA